MAKLRLTPAPTLMVEDFDVVVVIEYERLAVVGAELYFPAAGPMASYLADPIGTTLYVVSLTQPCSLASAGPATSGGTRHAVTQEATAASAADFLIPNMTDFP